MTIQRATLYIVLLFAAVALYTAIVYPSLPDRIPIHWNIRGEIDGWGPKSTVLISPAMILLGLVLLHGLPALSPIRFKIDTFRPTFNYMMVIVSALFAFIAVLMIVAAQHHDFAIGKFLVAGISLFLAWLGNLLGKTRRNFYVGVRTPWTLASERVWNATHRVAARWMVAGGLVSAVLAFFGLFVACFGVIMVTCLYPVLFSFVYYKRLERSGGL